MTIIFKLDGTIIDKSETLSFVELVEQNKENLSGANLRAANLRGVDLSGANLEGADLRGAKLGGLNLDGAKLRGANLRRAKLGGLNLARADLRNTNLSGANLRGANLEGAKGFFQVEKGLLQKVAQAALSTEDSLDMYVWHKCETTHCIAGWACFLAENKELGAIYGTAIAGQMLLGLAKNSIFYTSNEEAKEWLKQYL
jgi:hypothetical protein